VDEDTHWGIPGGNSSHLGDLKGASPPRGRGAPKPKPHPRKKTPQTGGNPEKTPKWFGGEKNRAL